MTSTRTKNRFYRILLIVVLALPMVALIVQSDRGSPVVSAGRAVDPFAGADSDDVYWGDSFVFRGLNRAVRVVRYADGMVYAGGEFTLAGGKKVDKLTAWDGASWRPLDSWNIQMNVSSWQTPEVNAILASGDTLYVGGMFDRVGSVYMGSISMWDGNRWRALGQGLASDYGEARVNAIALYKGDLYVAGLFSEAGSLPVSSLAVWDGNSWSSVTSAAGASSFLWGQEYALLVKDGVLYIGGRESVRSWDGRSWRTLGDANGEVYALACDSARIYAAGDFTTIGSVAARSVAYWEGGSWHSLGTESGVDGKIYALACWRGDLYAGGDFITASGLSANHIRRWDGNRWLRVGAGISNGTDGTVYSFTVTPNKLIVAGDFLRAGDVHSPGAAVWNGSAWGPLAEGVSNTVNEPVSAIAVSDSVVYVGGQFEEAGACRVKRVAAWKGSEWSNLGGGVGAEEIYGETVNALVLKDGKLICGGRLYTAEGRSAGSLVIWNGSAWQMFGGGVWKKREWGDPGYVHALAERNGAVYVGGSFVALGSIKAGGIGRWIGGRWDNMGQGVGDPQRAEVLAVAFHGDEVVIGGRFTVVDMQSAMNIARWDGSGWYPLGEGVMGTVYAIAVVGDTIYAGGEFEEAGASAASNIAMWYEDSWHPMGEGLNGPVKSIATIRGEVYAGGEFTASGKLALNHIAKWNGRWVPLGSGLNGEVVAMAARGDELFIGGDFSRAGARICNYFARWYKPFPVYLAIDTLRAEVAREGVRITWEAVVKKEIRGIQIYRIGSNGVEVPLCSENLLDRAASEYVDRSAIPGRSYTYIVALVRLDGTELRSDPVSVALPAPPTALLKNYPNPFKSTTTIPFTLGADGHVVLKIFDIRGRLVATLADDDLITGPHERIWNGRNERGRVMPSGVYVYFLDSGYARLSGKMVLVR